MINDEHYEAWLRDPSTERVVLCHLHHSSGVKYVASRAYVSWPSDSEPHRVYDDIMSDVNDIETRIDGQVSFGDVSLVDDGALFDWFDLAWEGHPIRLYLGNPAWSLNDFRLIALGVNGGISSAENGDLTFEMMDTSQVLKDQVDTGQLPDGQGEVPLLFGSLFNVPAHRLNTKDLKYRVSYLPILSCQPRDNGNAVPSTAFYDDGSFELANNTNGTVTAEVHEQHDTPLKVVQWVAARYDVTLGDVDLPGGPIGLYFSNSTSGTEILDTLCEKLGAYWFISRLGHLNVKQFKQPSGFVGSRILADDIVYKSVALAGIEYPWKKLVYRWGNNHSVLSNVAGIVHDEEPELAERLKDEWRTIEVTTPQEDFPLAEEVERASAFFNREDAESEAVRLLALKAKRREIWDLDTFLPMLEVGTSVEIEHPRTSGRPALIISVSLQPLKGKARIEVWLGGYWAEGEIEEAQEKIRITVNEDLA